MSGPKLGIEAIEQLALAVAHAATAIDGVFADGKVDWRDAGRLPALLASLGEMAKVPFSDIVPELADFTPEEHEQLAKAFAEAFQLSPEHVAVETIVEGGFALILDAMEALEALRQIGGEIKARFVAKAPAP